MLILTMERKESQRKGEGGGGIGRKEWGKERGEKDG